MDIKELLEHKNQLRRNILELICDFEEMTSTVVEVRVGHFEINMMGSPTKKIPEVDVSINL